MSGRTDLAAGPEHERRLSIGEMLRAEWRMIASVSLLPTVDADGFEAEVRLDPVLVKGAAEQQGYPRTADALATAELRRRTAIEGCVQRVNQRLPDADRIRSFSISC